jgi:hypothetical protein
MAITYPFTARYFVRFRHSDTALTPSFTYFKRSDTLVGVTAPTISEVGGGTYYFDYIFSAADAPDIVFEIDGGASIPTEEVRYISDTISMKDHFIDEPVSQVVTDVWSDTIAYGGGSKGEQLSFIGTGADDIRNETTLFGRLYSATAQIMGASPGEWTPFPDFGGNTVKEVYDRIGTPVAGDISTDLQNLITNIKGISDRDLSQVYTLVDTTNSNVGNAIIDIGVVDSVVDAIKLKTDLIQGATLVIGDINTAVNSIKGTDTAQTLTTLKTAIDGVGTGQGTVAADVTAIRARTDNLPANTSTELTALTTLVTRALGMLHENSVLDTCTYDQTTNNLTSARLRLYDSSTAAQNARNAGDGTEYLTGMIARYSIVCQYSGDNMTSYLVVREFPA